METQLELMEQIRKGLEKMSANLNASKEIGNVHLHIGNAGTSISILDKGDGPTIVLTSSAFGNLKQIMEISTDRKSLQALADLFKKGASFEEFSEDYCHKASVRE